MKLQINLLIGIVIILSSCKTYKGSYCTLPNYTGACIEILNKKELLFKTGTDYGEYGINYGKYQIKKDTLIVEYLKIPEKYKLKNDEKIEIINYELTDSYLTKFDIKCQGTWAANIYCRNTNTDTIVYGNTTNSDGELKFELANEILPINLIADYKKSKVQIPINKIGNYKIEIILNELIGGTSYNSRMWTVSKFLKKKGENGIFYFQQIGNEKWGKYFKSKKKKKTVANKG